MARLFISYAREDRAFVDRLATALARAQHDVWYDRDLNVGSFRAQIDARLAESDVVIVVWSARSSASRYVHDEAQRAVDRMVLLPIRVDDTVLPLGFGGLETLDLSRWSGKPDTPAFKRVLDEIQSVSEGSRIGRTRPSVRFVGKSITLTIILAAIAAPALVVLSNIKRGEPAGGATVAEATEAFALAFACGTPVMLWCGYQVRTFGLSHVQPILRRAAWIYAVSALLALSIIAIAVAAGVTAGLPPIHALAQLGFVGLVATLGIGATLATVRAGIYFVRRFAA